MPLADAGRHITLFFKERRDGFAIRLDERRRFPVEDSLFHAAAPGIAPGEQPVPRGRANGRGRVGVREPHPFTSQPVDARRGDLRGAVATDVAVTQVVGENDDDVGMAGCGIAEHNATDRQKDRHGANLSLPRARGMRAQSRSGGRGWTEALRRKPRWSQHRAPGFRPKRLQPRPPDFRSRHPAIYGLILTVSGLFLVRHDPHPGTSNVPVIVIGVP